MLQTITVTFDAVKLETGGESCFDWVSVYNGPTPDESSLIRKCCICNNTTVTSSGATVLVVFQSDRNVNIGSFTVSWQFADSGGYQFIHRVRKKESTVFSTYL